MQKKKWLTTAVTVMAMALLSACGSNGSNNGDSAASPSASASASEASSEEVLSFKMGVEPWVGYAPWWIAAEEGIFEKYGLDVTVVNFNQDSDINAAFASDNIKVANIAAHTAIKMVGNNDLNLNGIVLLDQSRTADAVLATGSVKSVADLKGKKVAFEEGTTSDLLLREALSDNGMTIDDVKVVYMPASDAGLALLSGKVDAAVTYEPYISTVKSKGDVQLIYSGENAPGLISDVAVIKADYLAEHPEVKDKLKQVWDETLAYWNSNQKTGDKIVAEKSGLDAADLPVILEGLDYFTSADQTALADSGDFLKTAGSIQTILTEQKVLDKQVDLEQMFQLK
ncbi:ABC transporter substrate-binding protein [Cohnella sp. AR92]|uniref:ABC transporter substrate-binding protein n=1 Tax=Cohnella sp. AR92 TaxID=648716 RepID=UPI000F8DD422|nr:ABC transporter substrate-binding protein [Cohnella sp. AR92]RUS46206.1 transporter substrate-binding domain-containing protein [Cohnella sp. AR92]